MANELVFYTHPMSRGRIVRWMLEETGCAYRTERLEYGTTMKSPAYLADAFPAAGLGPAVTSARPSALKARAIDDALKHAAPPAT